MHYPKRTLLRIFIVFFILVSAVLWVQVIKKHAVSHPAMDDFFCATKTISNIQAKGINVAGDIVIDFKTQRITLQLDVKKENNEHSLLYRDVYMKNLRRITDELFTFEIDAVKIFPDDNVGNFFSYFRLLHPGARNELRIQRIGEKTYLFSLNRQIYNVCTAS